MTNRSASSSSSTSCEGAGIQHDVQPHHSDWPEHGVFQIGRGRLAQPLVMANQHLPERRAVARHPASRAVRARRRQRTHGIPEAGRAARLANIAYLRSGRLRPSRAIRVSSVVGFRPSRAAAPPSPRIAPMRAFQHRAEVLPLDVDQLQAAPGRRIRRRRHGDGQPRARCTRSWRARRCSAARGCCRATDTAAAP